MVEASVPRTAAASGSRWVCSGVASSMVSATSVSGAYSSSASIISTAPLSITSAHVFDRATLSTASASNGSRSSGRTSLPPSVRTSISRMCPAPYVSDETDVEAARRALALSQPRLLRADLSASASSFASSIDATLPRTLPSTATCTLLPRSFKRPWCSRTNPRTIAVATADARSRTSRS